MEPSVEKQINLVEQRGLGCKLAEFYREFLEQLPTTFVKWLSAGLYRQEDRPPRLTSSALNLKDYFLACSIKMQ